MKSGDFGRAWGGIAGVQSTLAVLLDRGHHCRELVAGSDRIAHRGGTGAPVSHSRQRRHRRRHGRGPDAGESFTISAVAARGSEAAARAEPVPWFHFSRLRRTHHPARRNHLRGRQNHRAQPADKFVRPSLELKHLCIIWDRRAALAAADHLLANARYIRPRAAAGNAEGDGASFISAPAAGRGFTQYTAEFEPGGSLDRRLDAAILVCAGRRVSNSTARRLVAGRLCVFSAERARPPSRAKTAARAAIIEKPYQPLPGVSRTRLLHRPRRRHRRRAL